MSWNTMPIRSSHIACIGLQLYHNWKILDDMHAKCKVQRMLYSNAIEMLIFVDSWGTLSVLQ